MSYRNRRSENKLSKLFDAFQIIAVTGPRQCGKSTMIKHYIESSKEDWKYYSLDNKELLQSIKNDPTSFIKSIKSNIAIDEAQKAPDLFHSLKEFVDKNTPYKIILSGSANFLLMKNITESLAGRVGFIELLPFSLSEAYSLKSNNFIEKIITALDEEAFFNTLHKHRKNTISHEKLLEFIFIGGFPKIHLIKKELLWEYFQSYITTYIEKDLRDLAQIGDLDIFQTVYKMFGYQTGNITNSLKMSSDIGIDAKTVKQYSSILETSYQCKFLNAFFSNKRTQLIKKPKVYFIDTGFVNYIYQNENEEEMLLKGSWGAILETHIFSEFYKEIKDMANKPTLNFWRTNSGAEVDFIIEYKRKLYPIEVKGGMKIDGMSTRGIKSFIDAEKERVPFGIVLYRGEELRFINEKIILVPLTMIF